MPSTWNTHPNNFGQGSRKCKRCQNHHGIIRKYGLNLCRRCFREEANTIGFFKVRIFFLLFQIHFFF